MPRVGRTPFDVVEVIHRAGGLASMAHPGVTRQPPLMSALVDCRPRRHRGLSLGSSTVDMRRELQAFAATHHLLVTGGSDFHGDDDRDRPLGGVTLPEADFARLETAARDRRAQ